VAARALARKPAASAGSVVHPRRSRYRNDQ
jgi:hypothetical protein